LTDRQTDRNTDVDTETHTQRERGQRGQRERERVLEQKYFKMLISLRYTKTYSSKIHTGTTSTDQVCDTTHIFIHQSNICFGYFISLSSEYVIEE